MITIAVTGGIGSGKSTVSAALRDLGAVIIDSDRLAREVVAPGTPGLAAIEAAFGPEMVGTDGALDRSALAAVVFADPDSRVVLEGITHPLVRARFVELQAQAPPDAVVVNDIPLLTTLSAAASYHLVIGVQADVELRVRRLIERGLSESDARARIGAQVTDAERAPLCDVLMRNHGARHELDAVVRKLWTERLVPFEENVRFGRPAPRRGHGLVVPRAGWLADARRLAARISTAVGGTGVDHRVDHVGSTAVPGLLSRDVIDLQLTVSDPSEADAIGLKLEKAGFPRSAVRAQDVGHLPDIWSNAGTLMHVNADPGQSINLYVRVRNAADWWWALLFRDWLTVDPEIAAEYLAVKQRAMSSHAGDSSASDDAAAKEQWFAQVYERGLAWAGRTGWAPDDGTAHRFLSFDRA